MQSFDCLSVCALLTAAVIINCVGIVSAVLSVDAGKVKGRSVDLEFSVDAVVAENKGNEQMAHCARVLEDALREELVTSGFVLNPQRKFTGVKSDPLRVTLTQQSSLLGHFGVQMELCNSFRKRLKANTTLRLLFAECIRRAWGRLPA